MTEDQKAMRRAALNYQLRKSIDASGDKMTMPGIALGGLAGSALGSRGRVGALGGAAIGGALGAVGLRIAGRVDERRRLLRMKKEIEAGKKNLESNLKPAIRELAARSEKIVEFALVRDANGQLVESDNGGSGFKTAAKVGLGAAGAAGAAVIGTRWHHANKAMQDAGGWKKNWADVAKMGQAGNAQGIKDWQEKIGASAQKSARAGWMGKLGKVGNFLTKF